MKPIIMKPIIETKEYWKKRCELAEDYIGKIPCDHDVYEAFIAWEEFKNIPTIESI